MQHLDTKRVTQMTCGRNFVIALGQTLVSHERDHAMPLGPGYGHQASASDHL